MALIDVGSATAKEVVKTTQEALSQAIKDYKTSESFKQEVREESDEAYWIGFRDGRDAIAELYPNLDLSSITVPTPKKEAIGATPIAEETTPIAEEITPTSIQVESVTIRVQKVEAIAVTEAAASKIT